MKKNIDHKICPTCRQSTIYFLSIDRGTVKILKQIARFIGKKGINAVHPRKEMEGNYLTSNEVGNLTRARAHGLIAKIADNPGNYLLTTKGARFLHGGGIPKTAIRSKTEERTIGYLEEDGIVQIDSFNGDGDYWEGIGYTIDQGFIIQDPTDKKTLF